MRILKPGGEAVLTFPNWDNYPPLKNITHIDKFQYKTTAHDMFWFYYDELVLEKDIFNFVSESCCEHKDLLPGFRDLVIYFKKNL